MQKIGPLFRTESSPTAAQPTRRGRPIGGTGMDSPAASTRYQIDAKRMSPDRRTPQRPDLLTRRWFPWISGSAVAALSFFVALWLTSPDTVSPGVAILTSATVSDATSLMAAVQTANLRGTPDVKGAIEAVKRVDDQRVIIQGWAVDKTSSSFQLTIIIFAGGTHVFTAMTNGARKDVAQMFGLSEAAAKTVSFEANFRCGQGQKLVIVAVTSDRTYSQFHSVVCP